MKRDYEYRRRRTGQRHRWCIRASVWRYMLMGLPSGGR